MKLVNVIEHVGDGYFQLQGFDRLTFCYNVVKGQKVLLPEFFQVTNKETGEGVLHKLRATSFIKQFSKLCFIILKARFVHEYVAYKHTIYYFCGGYRNVDFSYEKKRRA